MKVLDGCTLYEDGKSIGKLDLTEGQKSERMILIERFSGEWCDLKQTELTESDRTKAAQITESAGGKKPRILMALEGRFQASDTKNANGRIYPGTIWEKIIPTAGTSPVLGRIARGEMLGEVDHPGDGQTLLKRVGCMTTDIRREGTDVRGRMVVFDTAVGRDVKAIVEGGGRVGVSSRGQGSVVRLEGTDVVQDDYQLETWDVVHNPSTPGAYPDITIQESAAPPQQEERMGKLADLRERFERLKKHADGDEALTESALTILAEEAKGMASELTEGKFTGSAAEVAAIATDVQYFLNRIGQLRAKPIKGIPLGEEGDPLPAGAVPLAEKGDPKAYAAAMKKAQRKAGIYPAANRSVMAADDAYYHVRRIDPSHPFVKNAEPLLYKGSLDSESSEGIKKLIALLDKSMKAEQKSGNREIYNILRDAHRKARAGYNESTEACEKEEECSETFQRATTADETVEVLENIDGLREKAVTLPMTRFVHEARKAYRDAAQVNGMVHRHELDGISTFVRKAYESVEKGELSEARKSDGRRRLDIIVPNAGRLNESAAKLMTRAGGLTQSSPGRYTTTVPAAMLSEVLEHLACDGATVVCAESAEAFTEAAERFQPLLDRQMSLTQAALTEAATSKAWVTEMSAVIANVKQAMQALTEKVREKSAELKESQAKVDAAVSLVEAFAREFGVERVRGAVQAVAGLHPNIDGLPDKLSEARSVDDCVKLTRGEVYLENLPVIQRDERVLTEVVEKSQRAEQKVIAEQAKKPGRGKFNKSIVETTANVVEAMESKYGR